MRGLLLATLVLAAGHLCAAAESLDQALERLQNRYETTRTLTATFRQTVDSPTLAGTIESHGTVAFAKPNRMRWDYAPPDRQTIIGDGETLWIYQPDDKQVIKAPLAEAMPGRTPLNFLAGLGHIGEDFVVRIEREEAGRWVLRLTPRHEGQLGTLVLTVRKADATVEEATIMHPLGGGTHLVFSGERRNVQLDPDLFHFTPPPGVDVVRPPA